MKHANSAELVSIEDGKHKQKPHDEPHLKDWKMKQDQSQAGQLLNEIDFH